jgi:hypothetical protein
MNPTNHCEARNVRSILAKGEDEHVDDVLWSLFSFVGLFYPDSSPQDLGKWMLDILGIVV